MSAALMRLVSVGTLTVMIPLTSVPGRAAPSPADAKTPPNQSPRSGSGVHYIYLVRHGDYEHGDLRTTQNASQCGAG